MTRGQRTTRGRRGRGAPRIDSTLHIKFEGSEIWIRRHKKHKRKCRGNKKIKPSRQDIHVSCIMYARYLYLQYLLTTTTTPPLLLLYSAVWSGWSRTYLPYPQHATKNGSCRQQGGPPTWQRSGLRDKQTDRSFQSTVLPQLPRFL